MYQLSMLQKCANYLGKRISWFVQKVTSLSSYSSQCICSSTQQSAFLRVYAVEAALAEQARVAWRMSDFPSVSLGAVLAGVQLLAVGFTRHTSGCTNSSWTSIESSTYICSSPCSEAQLISSACSTQKSHRCYSNCSSAAPSLHKSLLVES